MLKIRSERKDFDSEDDPLTSNHGGIRIRINKEEKVINHLHSNPENTNLLFYNFNAYNDSNG